MDIRELDLFLNLAASLHFGQTSRACNITPSGLTRAIQRLEQELGEPLFRRDNRSVSLTKAGEIFKDYASDVLQRHRKLRQQLATESDLRGSLSLYCSVTAILSILPDIIRRFRRSYPEINLNLTTGDAAMALPCLENGKADITIAAVPDRLSRQIVFLKFLETPLIFIAPQETGRNSRLAAIPDLRSTPIVMPERGLSRERCERWFADKNIIPTVYASVAGNEALIAMVAMGCGVGVVPRLVLENSPLQHRIAVLEVEPPLKPFTVGACTTKAGKRLPTVQTFWRIAEQIAAGHERSCDEDHPDHQ
ncbi:MAG: HTH-type transcriptional activator IlvY [Desulfofustis sp.]|nr:HTH-type transcriptional activator IlvY [Desulfofustis sp.]